MWAVHTVYTSHHEYRGLLKENEACPSFNLYASFFTLAYDLIFCIIPFLVIPTVIIFIIKCCCPCKKWMSEIGQSHAESIQSTSPLADSKSQQSYTSDAESSITTGCLTKEDSYYMICGKLHTVEDLISLVFLTYLLAPVVCLTSHLGYLLG